MPNANTTRKSNHIITIGPYKGMTIGQKKRMKRMAKNQSTPIVGPVSRRRNLPPNLIGQFQRLGLPEKPLGKDALSFYRGIPGLSDPGREFLCALTHPNNEEMRSWMGIPDSMPDEINPYVAIDDSYVLTWDPNMFTTAPPSTVTTYNIIIFTPPIAEIELVYALEYLGSSGIIRSNYRVVRNPSFATQQSKTVQGSAVTYFQTMYDIGYDTLRVGGSGLTLIPNSSSLNDQGNIVCGQLPNMIRWNTLDNTFIGSDPVVTGEGIIDSSDISGEFWAATLSVPEVTQLVQLDKKSRDGPYREGAYIVHVPSQPVMNLTKKVSVKADIIGAASNGTTPAHFFYPNSMFLLDQSAIETEQNFTADSNFNNGNLSTPDPNLHSDAIHPCVSEPYDMLTGFAYATGLSVQSAGSNVSTAGFKARRTIYFELTPKAYASSVAVYRAEHAEFDNKTLLLAAAISQRMPHALCSADNSFSGVLGKIWDVIYGLGKPLSRIAKYIPIPGSAVVGDLVEGGLDSINSYANAPDL